MISYNNFKEAIETGYPQEQSQPQDIGFYTLSIERAIRTAYTYRMYKDGIWDISQLYHLLPYWRTEILITDKCNFNCAYCRGTTKWFSGNTACHKILDAVLLLKQEDVNHIRISGGEPCIHSHIKDILKSARDGNTQVAVSSNGSLPLTLYKDIMKDNLVTDWSISLDGCCAKDITLASGTRNMVYGTRILDTITYLSQETPAYVSVGIVLTPDNIQQCSDTIKLAAKLGVSDIRIISSAQWNELIELPTIDNWIYNKYPILRYRIENLKENRNVRGLRTCDSHRCWIMMDDCMMSFADNIGYHFPCIIAAREGHEPIGCISTNMRQERIDWMEACDTHDNPICKRNCLDVCIDYNNSVETCIQLSYLIM